MKGNTRKLTAIGMFCALAYAAAALAVTVAVSLLELFTVSENGVLGLLMNVISSCSSRPSCPLI